MSRFLVFMFGFWAALGLALIARHCTTYDPIDHESGLGAQPGFDPPPAETADASSARSFPGAEARPSNGERPEGGAPDGILDLSAGGAGSSPALAAILDQYEFSTPTAEDIAWLTIDSWSQPEFLELTQEEAHELLALDDTMGLKGPDTMLSIAGPLPTLDDCRIAFRSQAVQAALSEALMWNALVIECGVAEIEKPTLRGNRHVREAKETALRKKVAADEKLMEELERATTYPSWTLWHRLYREWSK